MDLEKIRESCIGHFYSWSDDLFSFGDKEKLELLPYGTVATRIQPVGAIEALLYNIPSYSEQKKDYLNHNAAEKVEKRNERNHDRLFIYHVPFDIVQAMDRYEEHVEVQEWFSERSKGKNDNEKFLSRMHYAIHLRENLTEPYLIHHIKPDTPGVKTEMYIIGEKKDTSEVMETIRAQEYNLNEIIRKIFYLPHSLKDLMDTSYGSQKELIILDKTRWPAKSSTEIKWK